MAKNQTHTFRLKQVKSDSNIKSDSSINSIGNPRLILKRLIATVQKTWRRAIRRCCDVDSSDSVYLPTFPEFDETSG